MSPTDTACGSDPATTDLPVTPDPNRPIVDSAMSEPASRRNQRGRRARILATIRTLLTDRGLDGVTMREIAEGSGLSVQSIYNLVGPRDEAIVEAISEYSRHVGLESVPDPSDPNAVTVIVARWIEAIDAAPEFCRQVCQIYFSPSRHIYYHYRYLQFKSLRWLLSRQRRCGILRAEANVNALAEELMIFASSLCVEWSDRPFPLEQLKSRLQAGFVNLTASSVAHRAGHRARLDR